MASSLSVVAAGGAARLRSAWQRLPPAQRTRALGLGLILVVALVWVAASFVVQDLEGAGLHPFLLTYIANALFVVYLPIFKLNAWYQYRWGRRKSLQVAAEEEETVLVEEPGALGRPPTPGKLAAAGAPALPGTTVLRAAAVVGPLWYAAQWTFNQSLAQTSVTSNTILSSTSSLFTFGLSCLLLGERFVPHKLASIFLCIAGTAVVTLADSARGAGGQASLAGDVLCLLSACFYASYTIAIKRLLPDDEATSMTLFFGLMGALNAAVMLPVLLALQVSGALSLAALTGKVILLSVLKGTFDNVLSDYLWARAILLIGPTIATVGLSIQVPIALAADAAFKHPPWMRSARAALLTLSGGALVLAGFFGINLGNSAGDEERRGSDAGDEEACQPHSPGRPAQA